MGIDLDINESEKTIKRVGFFPFSKIMFERDYELFEEIKKLDITRCGTRKQE